MDGAVAAWEPGRRLQMEFADGKFSVTIRFEFAPLDAGTRVTHAVSIDTAGMLGKVMGPLIRAGNARQVQANLLRLKSQVEAAAAGELNAAPAASGVTGRRRAARSNAVPGRRRLAAGFDRDSGRVAVSEEDLERFQRQLLALPRGAAFPRALLRTVQRLLGRGGRQARGRRPAQAIAPAGRVLPDADARGQRAARAAGTPAPHRRAGTAGTIWTSRRTSTTHGSSAWCRRCASADPRLRSRDRAGVARDDGPGHRVHAVAVRRTGALLTRRRDGARRRATGRARRVRLAVWRPADGVRHPLRHSGGARMSPSRRARSPPPRRAAARRRRPRAVAGDHAGRGRDRRAAQAAARPRDDRRRRRPAHAAVSKVDPGRARPDGPGDGSGGPEDLRGRQSAAVAARPRGNVRRARRRAARHGQARPLLRLRAAAAGRGLLVGCVLDGAAPRAELEPGRAVFRRARGPTSCSSRPACNCPRAGSTRRR